MEQERIYEKAKSLETGYAWTSGFGPKEFGMSYLGSNLRKKNKIKAKRFSKQRKCS